MKDNNGCSCLCDIMIDANNPIIHNRWLNEVGNISKQQWENYNHYDVLVHFKFCNNGVSNA